MTETARRAGGAPRRDEPPRERRASRSEALGELPWALRRRRVRRAAARPAHALPLLGLRGSDTLRAASRGSSSRARSSGSSCARGRRLGARAHGRVRPRARGYYVHDLDAGRVYRAEIHAVDARGRERLVGRPSNEMMLPPLGPSPVVDDRFIRIPWESRSGASSATAARAARSPRRRARCSRGSATGRASRRARRQRRRDGARRPSSAGDVLAVLALRAVDGGEGG